MSSSALSNWKLSRSDDNVYWEVVHIATEQKNWLSNTPRRFTLGSDIQYLPIEKITFRGRVAIFGGIAANLFVTSQIKIGIATLGYIQSNDLPITSFYILCSTAIRCFGTFDRDLESFTLVWLGTAAIGGPMSLMLSRDDSYFHFIEMHGRIMLGGHLRGAVSHVQTNIRMATRMAIFAGVVLQLDRVRWASVGGISASGSFNSSFDHTTAWFVGSNTLLYFTATTPAVTSNLQFRVKIGGAFVGQLLSDDVLRIVGLTPIHIYVLSLLHTEDFKPYFKVLATNSGRFISALDWPTSRRTFAVTYVGIFVFATQGMTGSIWAKVGPPIIFNMNLVPPDIISEFVGRTVVQGYLVPTTPDVWGYFYIRTPINIFGEWTLVGGDDFSNIQIKNWKWFKADEMRWLSEDIRSDTKGLITITGHFIPSLAAMAPTEVYGEIYAVVPIVIIVGIYTTLAPTYSGTIFGRAPIYGKVTPTLGDDRVLARGSINVGKLSLVTELPVVRFRLLTIIHAVGILNNVAIRAAGPFLMTFNSYGRIANRGRMDGLLVRPPGRFLTILITGHVPIVPHPVYGSFITTLAPIIPDVFIRLRLRYGTLTNVLECTAQMVGFYICRGVLASVTDLPYFKTEWKLTHFAGTMQPQTLPPIGGILGHSRVLAQLKINLANFKLDLPIQTSPVYRGYIDFIIDAYQDSYIPAYNGGVFSDLRLIFKRLLYGKIETTTKSIQFGEIFGITPWDIKGKFITNTGDDYLIVFARVTSIGVLKLTTTPNAFKSFVFIGQTNVGYLDIKTLGLDPYKCEILGIAAHAIIGRIMIQMYDEPINSPNGFIQPLRVALSGRVKLYGQLLAPVQGVTYIYFRGGNDITGSWIGGDTMPDICYPYPWPCLRELEERIGHYIPWPDVPKIYWTLGYVVGHIDAFHKFPIIGHMRLLFGAETDSHGLVRVSIQAHMEIYVTINFEIQSHVDWLTGFISYGIFKGFLVSGKLKGTLKDFRSTIEVNVGSLKHSRLTSDFKHCVGNFGGIITANGFLDSTTANTTIIIGGKVPIPYEITFIPELDTLVLRCQLYTPLQTFGVFINHFLNELTIVSDIKGRVTIYGKGFETLHDIKDFDFQAKINNVLGVFIPTGRLDRVFIQILGHTPLPGENPGFVDGWFIAPIPSTLRGNIIAIHEIYQNFSISLENTTSQITMVTPIRIYGRLDSNLEGLVGPVEVTAWPTGLFVKTLQDATTDITFLYRMPIIITPFFNMEDVTGTWSGIVQIYGSIPTTLQDIFTVFATYHFTYGTVDLVSSSLIPACSGTAYFPCLDLPNERIYTVSGQVNNTLSVKRSYFMTLYDRDTTERVQKLSSAYFSPFDYAFDLVVYGQHFVLCTPAQTIVGSQVKTMLVDDEGESRFV